MAHGVYTQTAACIVFMYDYIGGNMT